MSSNLVLHSPRMASVLAFKCPECGMNFETSGLLRKHRSKFCVGKSDDVTRGLRSISPPRNYSPDDDRPGTEGVDDKVDELLRLKEQRARNRDLHDLEERMLLDKLEDTERQMAGSPPRVGRNRLPLSKHGDIRDLQVEYEKLREKEGQVNVSQPVPSRRHTPYSRNSNSSLSIHLDDDYRRYNPNSDQKLNSLATDHGRRMEYLSMRNKDLENKRDEIRRKLEGLGRKSLVPERDNTSDLLEQLRAQEERNQRSLDELKRQLWDMNRGQKVNVVQVVDVDLLSRNVGKSIKMLGQLEKRLTQLDKEQQQEVKDSVSLKSNKSELVNNYQKILQHKLEEKNSSKVSSSSRLGGKDAVSACRLIPSSREDRPDADPVVEDSNSTDQTVQGITLEDVLKQISDKQTELDSLKERLNESEVERPVYKTPPPPIQLPPPPPPAPPEPPKKNFIVPIYYGNSMKDEIRAIRQAYLQNNGNDPLVLAQLAQMEKDAEAIEDQMKRPPPEKPPKEKKDNTMELFRTLEMENQRLSRELDLLREQNLLNQNRDKPDREDELERALKKMQHEQLRKMYGLQQDVDDLKMMLLMNQNRPTIIQQPTPRAPDPGPPVSLRPYTEVDPFVPYDQLAGFVMFYDFILSLHPGIQACRLIVELHSCSAVMGEPTILPTVYTEPATRGEKFSYNYSNAMFGAKQAVPKCPPDSDLGIVVELQAAGGPGSEHDPHSLRTVAWTKIPLFDNEGKLMAGRFRIPMRMVPIKPMLHVSQCNRLPKFGEAELYYRCVNMREAEIHSLQQITSSNYNQYLTPQSDLLEPLSVVPASPSMSILSSYPQNIPPPPSGPPPSFLMKPRTAGSGPREPQVPQEQRLPAIQHPARPSASPPQILQDMDLGFQVDRVKRAEAGEGKIRLTAYYASTGKVVQSATSPVTCSTTAVRSNFKYGYHVFGQQEAMFQEVDIQGDMILIARFYLRKRNSDVDDFLLPEPAAQEASLYDEETLVAWAAVPLVLSTENLATKKRRNFNPTTMSINQGTHTLPLYQPPVPEPNRIPFEDQPYSRDWQRYGKSTLRVYIFQGQPRPGSLTPSDISGDEEDTLPEFAWLPLERKTPPKEPFLMGDGFDIYIDGCRYLPDSVTFSKVAGRILDRRYEVAGKDINTGIKLDSDVYNPVYEHKTEFRETDIPPTATLLCKIYTIDNFYKILTVVGYCTLNIFVETGTERQPVVDKPMQVSLNEGAHQLRMYANGPNGVDPLTESCLRDAGIRIVPCASVLVRIVKVSRGVGGKALESSKVPQRDWLRMGLWQPRPKYTDRVYFSSKCMPTRGETRLFHAMMRRTRRTIREVIALVAQAKESFLRSDKNMEEYIRNQLTKAPDVKPLDQDLNFICQYSPKNGIKVAIDSAVNLPWSNFTHVHMCLNPPAAFYMGAPHATYDKLTFTELLDLRSTNTSPAWKDGFKHFPRRSYHRFLTLIIHLQEISVTVAKENYKYGLLEQAWTSVQIFNDKYANTMAFQLPLFAGAPTQNMLKQLAREPCKEWMERNIRNNAIRLLEGSSMFVRVADARRDDELVSDISHNKLVEVNTDYIPVGLEAEYSRERPGKVLEGLVPLGKTPDQFIDNLKVKFKSLVYKLYEEGNV